MVLTADNIQKAYIAFFNRPADVPGLNYWKGYTGDAQDLLTEFSNSAEYRSDFNGLLNVQIITRVYLNLFGRVPEQTGLNYWLAQMDAGYVTIANVAYEILGGARNEDLAIINNKVYAATMFTNALGTSQQIEAYNNAGIMGLGNIAKDWLSTVNEYSASVQTAETQLDALLSNLVVSWNDNSNNGQIPGETPNGQIPGETPNTNAPWNGADALDFTAITARIAELAEWLKVASGTYTLTPETQATSNEQFIWNFLTGKGLNAYATAGLMGNLYAESGLKPTNLENIYEKSLGYTDEAYTAAVDNGAYTNFVNDSAGYGLVQWTYSTRKQALLDFAKAAGKSIGDLGMQLDFLWTELQGYSAVLNTLKAATSVTQASDAVLTGFEKPADQSDAVHAKRAGYGQGYYDNYEAPPLYDGLFTAWNITNGSHGLGGPNIGHAPGWSMPFDTWSYGALPAKDMHWFNAATSVNKAVLPISYGQTTPLQWGRVDPGDLYITVTKVEPDATTYKVELWTVNGILADAYPDHYTFTHIHSGNDARDQSQLIGYVDLPNLYSNNYLAYVDAEVFLLG